jgi:hypothetical protein
VGKYKDESQGKVPEDVPAWERSQKQVSQSYLTVQGQYCRGSKRDHLWKEELAIPSISQNSWYLKPDGQFAIGFTAKCTWSGGWCTVPYEGFFLESAYVHCV